MIDNKLKTKLVEDMDNRVSSMTDLVRKIKAGEDIDKSEAILICRDLQTTSKFMRKHLFA